MNKRFLILVIVLIILIVILIIMGIFSYINLNRYNMAKTFELKINESKTISGLTVTNKGGGHEILTEGGDLAFADIELKALNKKETIAAYSSGQKLWNGYLIIFEEVGWDGEFVKFNVKKVGEPKINENQALDMVEEYAKAELKFSQKDMSGIQTSSSDMGGYYSVSIFKSSDNQQEPVVSLKVDKFTGKILRGK